MVEVEWELEYLQCEEVIERGEQTRGGREVHLESRTFSLALGIPQIVIVTAFKILIECLALVVFICLVIVNVLIVITGSFLQPSSLLLSDIMSLSAPLRRHRCASA